jgi:hypothetical protein
MDQDTTKNDNFSLWIVIFLIFSISVSSWIFISSWKEVKMAELGFQKTFILGTSEMPFQKLQSGVPIVSEEKKK